MMKRTQLLEYIADPDLLSTASLQDLENLCDEFPYCQATHLLYIKALSEQKSVLYHSRLKKTAAHIPDRSVLYYLIHAQPKKIPLIVSEKREELFNLAPPPEKKSTAEMVSHDPKTAASIDDLLNRVKDLSTIEIPDLSPLAAKLENLQREHLHRVEDIVRAYLTLRAVTEAEFLKEKEEAVAEFNDQNITEEEVSFENAAPAAQESKEETTVSQPENTQLTPDPETVDTEIPPTKPTTKHKTEQKGPAPVHPGKKALLINKFIETAPSMPKPKKEFYNPVNMAHNSTVDREDLVSETLAEIYLKQGNIQKALKIYQRLCLIIPEKSTYFAARIEKLKKENNLL